MEPDFAFKTKKKEIKTHSNTLLLPIFSSRNRSSVSFFGWNSNLGCSGRKGYTCADTTGSEKESWRDAYCSDPLRTDCHYLSAKKETHVHVIADLVRCDTLKFPSEKVSSVHFKSYLSLD